jgi:hypothetical protein
MESLAVRLFKRSEQLRVHKLLKKQDACGNQRP